MTDPIVSPWFIYMLSVVDSIGDMIVGAVIFTLTTSFTCLIFVAIQTDLGNINVTKKWLKKLKITIPLFVIFVLLSILIPSKNTIITMYATQFLTQENIIKAISTGKSIKDEIKTDIIDILNGVIDKKEEIIKE